MDSRIKYALEFITENYAAPLRLSQLAKKVHLSRSRFEHLFKQETGQTYTSYFQEVRMLKAVDFLKDTRLAITDVANKVGYGYLPNFDRDFKKRFGQTASEFRRKIS